MEISKTLDDFLETPVACTKENEEKGEKSKSLTTFQQKRIRIVSQVNDEGSRQK